MIGWSSKAIMPGGKSFNIIEGNIASIADTNTRWQWITIDMLPVWEAKTDAERVQLVDSPLGSEVQP